MENIPCLLKQNLDTLFRTKCVSSFNIIGYENGNALALIRMKPGSKSTGDTQPLENVVYKSRNKKQQRRDRKRCMDYNHGYNTRSKDDKEIEAPRNSDQSQQDNKPFDSKLSPDANVFVPHTSSPLLSFESPVLPKDPHIQNSMPSTAASEAKHSELLDTAEEILSQHSESEEGALTSHKSDSYCQNETSFDGTLDTVNLPEIETTMETLSKYSDNTDLGTLNNSSFSHSENGSDESNINKTESCSHCGASTDEDSFLHLIGFNDWVFFCSSHCEEALEEKYSEYLPKPTKQPPDRLKTKTHIPSKGLLNLDGTYG